MAADVSQGADKEIDDVGNKNVADEEQCYELVSSVSPSIILSCEGREGVVDTPEGQDESLPLELESPDQDVSHVKDAPGDGAMLSFSAPTQQQGVKPGEKLFVFDKKTSSTEVVIKVISLCSSDESGKKPGEAENEADACNEKKEGEAGSEGMKESSTENSKEEGAGATSKADREKGASSGEYRCEHCDFSTNKKHLSLIHQVQHAIPDKDKQYHCSECDYSSGLRHNLKVHIKRHVDISELDSSEVFTCPEPDCDYTTMYKHDLQIHAKKHDPEQRHRCFHCNFTSIYKHSLLHHISSKHQGLRPYQCTLCDYSAAKKKDLETHMYKHSNEKPLKCSVCDYETPYATSLKSHMHKHKGSKPYRCSEPWCKFSTTSKSYLMAHIARHSKDVSCEVCGFVASCPRKLDKHTCRKPDDPDASQEKPVESDQGESCEVDDPVPVKRDNGTIEYQCGECAYRTTNKHSMKRHRVRHDPDRQMPAKMYVCDDCGYETAYKNSLKRHKARHSLVKPFSCGHCSYTAINMSQMHIHIAKHTGVKPFACQFCSYASACKQHLVNHMAKHSKTRIKCSKCDYTAATKDRLSVHLKRHAQRNGSAGPVSSRGGSKGGVVMSPVLLDVAALETGEYYMIPNNQVLQVVNVGTAPPVEGADTVAAMDQLASRIAKEVGERSGSGGEGDEGEDMEVDAVKEEETSNQDAVAKEDICIQQAQVELADCVAATVEEDLGQGTLVIVTGRHNNEETSSAVMT